MSSRFDPRVAAAVLVLFGACGFAAVRVGVFRDSAPARTGSGESALTRDDAAPPFEGVTRWINSPPRSIESLRGHVVLIDFWTYSCINCLRTIPELRAFYQRYHAAGLDIVGVHSPEFGFEKIASNVAHAVAENKVVWPVAMDNDLKTWQAYENHYWPHVYVVDAKGRIRFDAIGEGQGSKIEAAIRFLLRSSGAPLPPPVTMQAEVPNDGITSEIYLGYERGYEFFKNPSGYVRDKPHDYRLPPAKDLVARGDGTFYLGGSWTASAETVSSGAAGAQIVLPFTARNVFIVAGSGSPGTARMRVELDGRPIPASESGSNVTGSTLAVGGQDLYRVVRLPRVEQHRLTLTLESGNAAVYTFTFG